MKKKLLTASVFVFGLMLGGASASASSLDSAGPGPSQITPEMAQCIADCQASGQSRNVCWACCVQNICPVD